MEDLRQRYVAAVDALNRRQWLRARQLAESLLPQLPQHAGVHFVIGVAALEQVTLKDGFRHLLMATKLSPQRTDYAAQFARLLLECHQPPEALKEAERAMKLPGSDPMTLNTLAVVFTRCAEHASAANAFRRAVELAPDQPSLHFNLATSLMAIGEIDGAIQACETCIRLQPRYWRAHLTLAQLSRQTAENNHVDRLQALLQYDVDPEAQLYLNLALEKEYDDLGQPEKAMSYLISGKLAWQPRLDRSGPEDSALFDSIIEASTDILPAGTRGQPGKAPIFIMGMPRSGTTLLERILSSHSMVHSAGELQQFPVAFKKASGVHSPWMLDPQTLAAAKHIDWAALGQDYLQTTRTMSGKTPSFIDKLPHNFLYAGWIAQALPEAKIICLRRDPMDTCIANFRQLFAMSASYNYSFDLLDCGRYYIGFDRLMAHWQKLLPGRILEVNYEDIVTNQVQSTHRLLEFCELPWEDACLSFEHNSSPVSTASAIQVRSPIYRSSMQRWKRYGPMVDGLRDVLRAGGVVVDGKPATDTRPANG
ncbi:tetratricopeptide repeat-containing sulfotransferase family protein [Pseudoxanthomonas sp.]|uniref:tetratricopeptide repeat-containing sulfotransferase family protein n=1 Tax=Pseudoxanthomonas sp. TaxID=1871049 RepID=UPI00261B4A30|nr:tetratricopeptide repeat-containing sulfotransferase family protein [Pseudoxanthomonas sp.]WDS36438.1 MAG: sulfotransferase [Pseudoxanthomonas sp.]